MLTGNSCLYDYLFRYNLFPSSSCPYSEDILDSLHVFYDYPHFTDLRRVFQITHETSNLTHTCTHAHIHEVCWDGDLALMKGTAIFVAFTQALSLSLAM